MGRGKRNAVLTRKVNDNVSSEDRVEQRLKWGEPHRYLGNECSRQGEV